MTQNVSVEAALPVFRQRCSELHDANLILQARVNELEAELEQARASAQPAPPSMPGLGAAPAEQAPYGNHANLDQQNDMERVHE
jgi:hypothetical protein